MFEVIGETATKELPSVFIDGGDAGIGGEGLIEFGGASFDAKSFFLTKHDGAIGASSYDLRGVGTEAEAAIVIKLVDSADKGHRSFAEEIIEAVVWIDELFDDRDDETHVGANDPIAVPVGGSNQAFDTDEVRFGGGIDLEVALELSGKRPQIVHALKEDAFFFGSEEVGFAET